MKLKSFEGLSRKGILVKLFNRKKNFFRHWADDENNSNLTLKFRESSELKQQKLTTEMIPKVCN